MTTPEAVKLSLLGKLLSFCIALGVVFLFLTAVSHAAPTTTVISQPSGVPTAFVNSAKPTSTTTLYTAIGNIDDNVLLLNREFLNVAPMLDYIAATSESIQNSLSGLPTQSGSCDLTSVTTQLSDIQTRLTRIEQKIDALPGENGVTQGELFISGLLLAVVFAVTWRG